MKRQKTDQTRRLLSLILAVAMVITTLVAGFTFSASAAETPTNVAVNEDAGDTYTIFASGRTDSEYYEYNGSKYNYDETTVDNGGYDLYCTFDDTIRLGRSFTVESEITEKAQLSVMAFDTDEEWGESDGMFLVDETTGTEVRFGKLSGWDWTWNTTTLEIDPSNFTVGHTYHIKMTEEVSGWHVWVRNVTLKINGFASTLDADLDGSIDVNGAVAGTLYAIDTAKEATYNVEFKVVEAATGYQRGYAATTMAVTAAGSTIDYALNLESGSPEGIYQIFAIFTDQVTGATVHTVSITRGFPFAAVSYNANGGSNNLPIDTVRYTAGDEVAVLFDYIPSRAGYTFLGWSTDRNAVAPEYTEDGTKSFIIGEDDITLYAIWSQDPVVNTAKLIVDNVTATVGSTVNVDISLEDMPEIKSMMLYDFSYDTTKLELVDAQWKRSDGAIIDWDAADGEAVYAFNENTDANGVIFTLTFKLLEGAVSGDLIDIGCSAIIKEKSGLGMEKDVVFETVPGTIKVILRGDFNEDGFVDSDDAIYLLKATLAPEKYPLNQSGDVDGDSFVGSDDAIYLLKFTLVPAKYPLH